MVVTSVETRFIPNRNEMKIKEIILIDSNNKLATLQIWIKPFQTGQDMNPVEAAYMENMFRPGTTIKIENVSIIPFKKDPTILSDFPNSTISKVLQHHI